MNVRRLQREEIPGRPGLVPLEAQQRDAVALRALEGEVRKDGLERDPAMAVRVAGHERQFALVWEGIAHAAVPARQAVLVIRELAAEVEPRDAQGEVPGAQRS